MENDDEDHYNFEWYSNWCDKKKDKDDEIKFLNNNINKKDKEIDGLTNDNKELVAGNDRLSE